MKNKIALKNVTLGDIHTDGHVNIELEFCVQNSQLFNSDHIVTYMCKRELGTYVLK